MRKVQRQKYEMFVRVRNFGTVNRDVFPESSPGGKKFADLAAVVTTIENYLVRRAQARSEARKVKLATRRAVVNHMKALASTGREVAEEESGVHPFRMPKARAATAVLTTARLFMQEAERRADKFVELGMRPTFLTDFAARVDDLVRSVGVQQDSRGARHEAQAEIESALARGSRLIGQLDVTVANALSDDPGRLGRWHGARRMDHPSSSGPAEEPGPEVVAPEPAASVTPVIAEATPAVRPPEEVLKIAS